MIRESVRIKRLLNLDRYRIVTGSLQDTFRIASESLQDRLRITSLQDRFKDRLRVVSKSFQNRFRIVFRFKLGFALSIFAMVRDSSNGSNEATIRLISVELLVGYKSLGGYFI